MPEIIVKVGENIVKQYFFAKETMSVGRAPDNEIVIENLAISRNHANIQFEDGKYWVTDLGSSNGTYVNGVKVKRTELIDKDVITLGKHKLFFYDQRASDAQAASQPDIGDCTMLVTPVTVAQLTVTKGRQKGQTFILEQTACTLGKAPECDIQINDWFVSRQHAVIEKHNQDYLIRDLNSWRHTRVNGEIIEQATLVSGDTIQLGPTVTLNFALESSLREVSSNGSAFHPQDKAEPAGTADQANGRQNQLAEEWIKQYPQPVTAQEGGEPVISGLEATDAPDREEQESDPPAAVIEQMAACSVAAAADEASSAIKPVAVNITTPSYAAESNATNSSFSAQAEPVEMAPSREFEQELEKKATTETNTESTPTDEIRLWERALQNPSPVIRRQAARRLKQLTGKDYAY